MGSNRGSSTEARQASRLAATHSFKTERNELSIVSASRCGHKIRVSCPGEICRLARLRIMKRLKQNSRRKLQRTNRRKQARKTKSSRRRGLQKRLPRPSRTRHSDVKIRDLAAINRVRRGLSDSIHTAALAEDTSVRSIKRNFPKALIFSKGSRRIRVRVSDYYSAYVEILIDSGALEVLARGSRERELAGQHRATYLGVLRGKLPPSALTKFRGKRVGGQKLLSSYKRLLELAQGGLPDQLGELYVSPGTGA